MPRVVDLQLLRQMTADAMRVYEAVQQTQIFTEDGKQVLAAADQMLRETARVYLPDDVQIISTPEMATPSAREQLIAKYVEIQKAHALLKDALYRFAQSQVEAKAWNDARITFDALGKIETNYRDLAALREKLPVLQAADAELRAGQTAQAAQRLKNYLQTHPGDRHVSAFLEPVVTRLQKEEAERREAERQQREEQARQRKEELLQRIRTMEFISVPSSGFSIGKYPVTVAQFEAFVELTGYQGVSVGGGSNQPIASVSQQDALAFCDWASRILNKAIRLPTEQEWEKAAQSANGTYPNLWEWTSSPHEQGGIVLRNKNQASRFRYLPDYRFLNYVFRCAC